ncbi:hypothetical protein [Rhizohabitans arisaemae]|uniref:hypothetical protein n=1 Tax=Rhizohabitans arisaemae TaxID=2720610 RepID=UPI0024B168CF|nr:hypothetical protein [Rhizohabitans arisaemae]
MKSFPAERQKDLLVEHGLYGSFAAHWVSTEDINEVARRLQVAPESAMTCDFQTAIRPYEPTSIIRLVWITRHAPGWSHVLTLSGTTPDSEILSLERLHVFDLVHIGGIDRIYPLFYTYDGICSGDVFGAREYDSYSEDLESTPLTPTAELLEQYLLIMGRITGRFYDREWFSSKGLLCRIP